MSFIAIKWALAQPVGKASTKFVLVAMADCVNSETSEMLCWPSYAYLSRVTLHDIKTVEVAVFRLKESGLIVDTGMRRGETGKVVVYRLNAPKTGCIAQGPQSFDSSHYGPANTTESGHIQPAANPPVFPANPPKNGDQSPQISQSIPPKTGARTRKKQEGTRKERDRVFTSIPGVPDETFSDWMTARKNVPVTGSVLAGVEREAKKAGLTLAEAVIFCAEVSWRGFNAGWYSERMARQAPRKPATTHKNAAAGAAIFDTPQQDYIDV